MTIKEITEQLGKPTPIEDIDWRVQSITAKNGMIVLGYKDSRHDMARLDEVTGGAWSTEYRRDSKGVLQCTISIYATLPDGTWDWVSKTSNGVESFSEKEKGEYSDAFKRAGFMWGIGRDLYELPFIFIQLEEDEVYMKGNRKVNKLNPNELSWNRDSKGLLTAKQGNKIRFKERPSNNNTQAKSTPPNEQDSPKKTVKEATDVWNGKRELFVNNTKKDADNFNKTGLPSKAITTMIERATNEYKIPLEEIGKALQDGGVKVEIVNKTLNNE